MRLHFIAIGGAVMHNLALALQAEGHLVTGSDDEIRNPARERLAAAGLLPLDEGWRVESVTPDLDAVIVGMHAREDNPELLKARELNLPTYSFPEFIYEQCKEKQRIVVCGSHGKSSITALIIHVLRETGRKFDYMVGAQVQGFERQVRLTEDAPFVVLEGDEYFASPLDRRPKFLVYQPHLIVVSGIAWDHINAYPTEELYVAQFAELFKAAPKAAMVVYNKDDRKVRELAQKYLRDEYHLVYPYSAVPYGVRNRSPRVKIARKRVPIQIFGKHNAYNISAAWEVCKLLAVTADEFSAALSTFTGAAMRLQIVHKDARLTLICDFAHAPSKVKASVNATASAFKYANVIACLELHTFSSLNKEFLPRYRATLRKARNRIVYINPKTWTAKGGAPISQDEIWRAFRDRKIVFVTDKAELISAIKSRYKTTQPNAVLLMSSGNFDGLKNEDLF